MVLVCLVIYIMQAKSKNRKLPKATTCSSLSTKRNDDLPCTENKTAMDEDVVSKEEDIDEETNLKLTQTNEEDELDEEKED